MNFPRKSRQIAVAVLAAVLSAGVAATASAQSTQGAGTTGGSTADNTSAGNANGEGMPQIQHQGDVEYVSGGVGLDESKALQHAQSQWPLSLRFTGPGSEYLADVRVQIVDASGTSVLDATSRGPYMLVRLGPGHYTVRADHGGVEKTGAVTIAANGRTHAAFFWRASQ